MHVHDSYSGKPVCCRLVGLQLFTDIVQHKHNVNITEKKEQLQYYFLLEFIQFSCVLIGFLLVFVCTRVVSKTTHSNDIRKSVRLGYYIARSEKKNHGLV